ncbi:MAG TPA: ATP-binding protein [Fimbriimonas sp.]|nr:ATP-binding protein [Fimbriimonas sp.]
MDLLRSRVERLEAALREKDDDLQSFIYAVSHDLRAPLRSITTSSMILLEDYGGALDAEGKSELKRQDQAAKKLDNMLAELLKLSRLANEQFAPAEVDLVAAARAAALDLGVGEDLIVSNGPVPAVGDPRLLATIFKHLLDNSLKFAKPGEPPRVTVGSEGGAYFVRDNGIGFEPEQASRVFLPFERLLGDQYPGAGMGLTAVKRLVDRHGGRIWAQGTPSDGCTIWFTLPLPESVG